MPERIALVTGGGRGIGASIARSLANDGWSVVVGARSLDQVEAVAAEIGGRAVELDVSSQESVERAVAEAGAVELLVANAGVGNQDAPTWELDPATWWRTFEVNVLGVHLCCHAMIPGMLARGSGRIPVFFFSPGRVRTEMTSSFADGVPWTPPELAPGLVRKLATGRYDALAGRYLHAEHDDVDDLLARIDEVRERDLNSIRVQR